MERIVFEYWSDPLCIWAFVAQPRLERLIERWADCVEPRYHVVPVFGSIPWRMREGPWSQGGAEGRARATREIAATFGVSGVSGEGWLRDCPASSWPAGAAIKAAFAMEAGGELDPGVAAAFQLGLRRRFFLDAQNIARRVVQLEVAEAVGVSRAALERRLDDGTAWAALLDDRRRKEALQLKGSPTYVFDGGRAMLYGNFPPDILEATVQGLVQGREPGASAC